MDFYNLTKILLIEVVAYRGIAKTCLHFGVGFEWVECLLSESMSPDTFANQFDDDANDSQSVWFGNER